MHPTIKPSIRTGVTNIRDTSLNGTGSAAESISIIRSSERLEIRSGNALVGHVTDSTLYGIDRQGYAVDIGNPDDDREAVQMLKEWWNNVR